MAQAKTTRKAPADFKIKADKRKTMNVELVGETYQIKVPKSYVMLRFAALANAGEDQNMAAMTDAVDVWVRQAFGKEGAAAIEDRLNDPDDDIDLEHIMQLMEAVAEAAAGNPTT